jgi:hypothetical protein
METHIVLAATRSVIALVAAAGVSLAGCGSGSAEPAASTASSTATTSTTTTSTTGATAQPSGTGSAPVDTTQRTSSSALVPLWPFTTAAQVRQWQADYRSGGHQPWHLDAGQTALAFTRGHLGYTEIDRVTSRSINGDEAQIGVGWLVPGTSRTQTVAVLHLIRFREGRDAPWVVVGSEDTRLTLDMPRYGSTVTSPLRVGGRITGVDESLRVTVLGPASSTPLFASAGLPAGGERTPWSTTVRFRAPHGSVLTIAVSTGGHVKRVEAFAVTAVRKA